MSTSQNRPAGFTTYDGGGLPDRFQFTVRKSFYATDPGYNSGQTLCLIWKGDATPDDADMVIDTDERPLLFPCGDGWISRDGGKSATHPTRDGFTHQSRVGELIDRACDDFGIAETLAGKGVGTDAAIWEGLTFYLEREERTLTIKGEEKKFSVLLPTKFISEGGAANAAEGRKGRSEAADTQASPSEGVPFDVSGIDKKVLVRLKAAAKKADSAEDFAEAALDIDGTEEYMDALASGELYEAIK